MMEDLTEWMKQPIYFYGVVKKNEVFTQLGTLIGRVTFSHYSHSHASLNNKMMRHIRVEGTNGTAYFSKYSKPGNVICLKKCSEKMELRRAANRNRTPRHKMKQLNYGKNDANRNKNTKSGSSS